MVYFICLFWFLTPFVAVDENPLNPPDQSLYNNEYQPFGPPPKFPVGGSHDSHTDYDNYRSEDFNQTTESSDDDSGLVLVLIAIIALPFMACNICGQTVGPYDPTDPIDPWHGDGE